MSLRINNLRSMVEENCVDGEQHLCQPAHTTERK